jgi:hypothetical protein
LFCWSASCLIQDAGIAVGAVAVGAAIVALLPEVAVATVVTVTAEELTTAAALEGGELAITSATTITIEGVTITTADIAEALGTGATYASYAVAAAGVLNGCSGGLTSGCEEALGEAVRTLTDAQLEKLLDNDWATLGIRVAAFVRALEAGRQC